MNKGRFIVFEGVDGCGKSTYTSLLKNRLLQYNVRCVDEREPSDGILGLIARSAVKKKICLQPEAMAHLFVADRYEHIINDIIPCLDNGQSVICDRFFISNCAYQGTSMPIEKLVDMNKGIVERLVPDLTIFIDVEPSECLKRISKSRVGNELYDEYIESVRDNYFKCFEILKGKMNISMVDGNGNLESVFNLIWDEVKGLFCL